MVFVSLLNCNNTTNPSLPVTVITATKKGGERDKTVHLLCCVTSESV